MDKDNDKEKNKVINLKPDEKRTIGQRHIYTQEIIKLALTVETGDVLTYEAMSSLIGMDCSPGGPGYGYQSTAQKILQKEYNIVFENVENIGYRRLSHEEVAKSTTNILKKKKASLLKRSKRRIDTVTDSFESLSKEAQTEVTLARTIIAFESEMNKAKSINQIKAKIKQVDKIIGFTETVKLFLPAKELDKD